MALNTHSGKMTIDIVVAGLQSGSIKLRGNSSAAVDGAEKSAEIDAAYLSRLITDLHSTLKGLE